MGESLSLTLKRITARAVLFHGLPNAPCCVSEWKMGWKSELEFTEPLKSNWCQHVLQICQVLLSIERRPLLAFYGAHDSRQKTTNIALLRPQQREKSSHISPPMRPTGRNTIPAIFVLHASHSNAAANIR